MLSLCLMDFSLVVGTFVIRLGEKSFCDCLFVCVLARAHVCSNTSPTWFTNEKFNVVCLDLCEFLSDTFQHLLHCLKRCPCYHMLFY